MRIREKVYGPESAGVAQALESLGAVYIKLGQPDAAEPLFRRVLKIRQDQSGPDHAFSASGHSNLGDVGLARQLVGGSPPIVMHPADDRAGHLADHRQVDRRGRDQAVSRTFIGLCRAAWQMSDRSAADRSALFEETFAAGQRAWNTSAASALAKMTARIGAGETDLGRGIRKVQDLSERILRLHADDNRLLANWSATQRADPAYSALSEEFRAVSIARSRDTHRSWPGSDSCHPK